MKTGTFAAQEDTLKQYFHQLGSYQLLTKKEERELGFEIQHVQKQIKDLEEQTPKERTGNPEYVRSTGLLKRKLSQAKNKMIVSNLRLVVSVAKQFKNRGLSLPDLINEGNIGLMEAVDRFDPGRGARFSTYSIWWIKQAIQKACADYGKPIRLPLCAHNLAVKYSAFKSMLTEQKGQTPTIEDLAKYMNLSRKRVLEIASACKEIASLHVTIDEKEEMYLIDAIESKKISDPFESSFNRNMKEMISNALDKLETREAMVLRLRFGLDDGEPHTLRDISNYFGITRERIRQIQNKAMEKLRNFRMIQEHHYHYN